MEFGGAELMWNPPCPVLNADFAAIEELRQADRLAQREGDHRRGIGLDVDAEEPAVDLDMHLGVSPGCRCGNTNWRRAAGCP